MVKAAWVSAAVVASLVAQQPPATDPAALLRADEAQRTTRAAEWLRSNDPREVAWGAWIAKQDRAASLIPLLVEKVAVYQPDSERDRHDALLSVLDALIEMRAPMPPAEARKLFPEFAAQSLILLVRSKEDATPELLDIFRAAQANPNWLAAGNVLAKTWPPGFAALLLSRFTQHLTVLVSDPSDRGVGYGGGGSECGFSMAAPRQGWPQVGLYLLMQFPDRFQGLTATFLVGGDTPIFYYRVDPGNYENPPDDPGYCAEGDRDRYREKYLDKHVSVLAYPGVALVWTNDQRYKQELIGAVQQAYAPFLNAVASLQTSGLLTPAEATNLKPRMEMMISDDRDKPKAPLPTVQVDKCVTVRTAFTKPLR